MSLLVVIYALVFVAALLAVDRFLRLVLATQRKEKEINLRLGVLKTSSGKLAAYDELMRMRGLSKGDAPFLSIEWLSNLMLQSGIKAGGFKRVLFVLGMAVLSIIVWRLFTTNFYTLVVVVPISTVCFSIAYVMYVRNRRINKFVSQLSDAIDTVIRSLAAGHPLPMAINLVANEMKDPIGTEFGILSDELTYGTELDDAMLNLVHRVGAEETKLLAVSISVQRGTGGNLIEILENLSKLIRERIMMRAKIKAISAEGRITAMIMAVFPFLLYLLIDTLAPTYFDPLWASDYGALMITVCGVLEVLGVIILYRLVKFDF